MMAKSMKTLELHYSVIQFFISLNELENIGNEKKLDKPKISVGLVLRVFDQFLLNLQERTKFVSITLLMILT